MRKLLLFFALPLAWAQIPADSPAGAVQKSAGDWNRGDLAAFVQCYEASPETTFVGSGIAHGTEQILERYKRNYPTRERMGHLVFSDLAARMLTPELAIVTGRFALARDAASDGKSAGVFTLVMRKGAGGWRIIHDHTTAN
jgi:uncharacterized protein (TIGR02246 family)